MKSNCRINPILVTGVSSGLGQHCLEFFNGVGFSRQTTWHEIESQALACPYEAIIHAAFNNKQSMDQASLYDYLNDTLFLTRQLTKIPHKKFIFISSIDVYPKKLDICHTEDETISVNNVENMYGAFKLLSESIIKNETQNHLILRASALLGEFSRKNSLIKMLTEKNVTLSLAPHSSFNYILHSDVSHFITKAIANDMIGTFNLAVSTNVSLETIANMYHSQVTFGNYIYSTGQISNSKATSVLADLKRSSLDTVALFLQTVGRCRLERGHV